MDQPSRRAVLAGCGALLAGCTAPNTPGERSGATPTAPPATSLSASPLAERWTAALPGQYTLSQPALGEHLYVASHRSVFALDRTDGTRAWKHDLGALSHGFSPVVADATVLAGARDLVDGRRPVDRGGTPTLAAFETDGTERWRVHHPLGASPAVAADTVFLPETDDDGAALRALSLATGETRWHRRIDAAEAYTAPAVDGSGVVLAVRDDDGSTLVALTHDGEERWRQPLDGRSYQGPAADGRIAVGTDAGTVAVFDPDGTERWRTTLDGPVYTTPALDGERTYAATSNGVVALGPDGAERWRGLVDDVGKTGVVVADGVAHLGGNEVAGFDATSGTPGWRVELPGLAGTFGAPLAREGVVYTGGCIKTDGNSRYDHAVYALETE